MDWLEQMNLAIDYIEENLAGDISYDRAAHLACCSRYHFMRMFPYLTGMTLPEYIRCRRLTLAAFELQATDSKVIDIALKYSYESPEAFSRAFKKMHGISPEASRRPLLLSGSGKTLVSCPRVTFHISVKGGAQMKYRITHREAFQVFGVYTEVSTRLETAFQQVPQFCRTCDDNGSVEAMNRLLGRFSDNYTLSALYDYGEESFKYMLCNFLPRGLHLPECYTQIDVPASTWVIFDVSDGNMQAMWRRIYTEWFPDSGYEVAPGVQFEMYYGLASHENGFGEIWLPVQRKS